MLCLQTTVNTHDYICSSILLPYESQFIRNFPLSYILILISDYGFYLARVVQSENNMLNIN